MPVSASFKIFILAQLEPAALNIRARAMFGGVGIYAGDHFFALLDDDTLCFKVDDQTRPKYTRRGMGPFRPYGEDGEVMQYYHSVAHYSLIMQSAMKPICAPGRHTFGR